MTITNQIVLDEIEKAYSGRIQQLYEIALHELSMGTPIHLAVSHLKELWKKNKELRDALQKVEFIPPNESGLPSITEEELSKVNKDTWKLPQAAESYEKALKPRKEDQP